MSMEEKEREEGDEEANDPKGGTDVRQNDK